jgi:hypothetical protein
VDTVNFVSPLHASESIALCDLYIFGSNKYKKTSRTTHIVYKFMCGRSVVPIISVRDGAMAIGRHASAMRIVYKQMIMYNSPE